MEIYPSFTISENLAQLAQEAQAQAAEQFARIEANQRWNQQKLLHAFQEARVSESYFAASTGWMKYTPPPLGPRTPWCGTISSAARTP